MSQQEAQSRIQQRLTSYHRKSNKVLDALAAAGVDCLLSPFQKSLALLQDRQIARSETAKWRLGVSGARPLEEGGVKCQNQEGKRMNIIIEATYEAGLFKLSQLLPGLKEREDAAKYSLH